MSKERSRKPFKHKWPKGWRPGEGESKPKKDWGPSIVRDRNPMSTEIAVKKGEQDLQPDRLQTSYTFYKAGGEAAAMSAQALGKHREKVKVTRGGKTFYQDRLVGRKPKEDKPKGETPKDEEKPSQEVKAHDDHKGLLNKLVTGLRNLKPGSSGKVEGHTVDRHSDGKHFRISGLIVLGFRAASVIMMGVERVSASAGQTATGSLAAGAEMSQGGQATRDIEAVGAKVTARAQQATDGRDYRRKVVDKHSDTADDKLRALETKRASEKPKRLVVLSEKEQEIKKKSKD